MIANAIMGWVVAHQEYFYGLATGYALTHIPQLVHFAFHKAMQIPVIRAAVLKDPKKSKELAESILREIEKGIDEEAATSTIIPKDIKVV